jgi:hypothetical protein
LSRILLHMQRICSKRGGGSRPTRPSLFRRISGYQPPKRLKQWKQFRFESAQIQRHISGEQRNISDIVQTRDRLARNDRSEPSCPALCRDAVISVDAHGSSPWT